MYLTSYLNDAKLDTDLAYLLEVCKVQPIDQAVPGWEGADSLIQLRHARALSSAFAAAAVSSYQWFCPLAPPKPMYPPPPPYGS